MPSKTIRFSDELHDAIQAVAEREDRSFSYVVQRGMKAWLAAQEHSPFSVTGKLARQRALESGLPSVDDVLEDRAPVEKEPSDSPPRGGSAPPTSGDAEARPIRAAASSRPAHNANFNRAGKLR